MCAEIPKNRAFDTRYLVQCLVNSVTLSGKSGASSDKAEDEGVAGSYVKDENAAKGVI